MTSGTLAGSFTKSRDRRRSTQEHTHNEQLAGAGSRMQFTLEVADVDATTAQLTARGANLLNGPVDRPWGIRTASFQDPAGHIWEIAH